MLFFLDGVYVDSTNGANMRFRCVKASTSAELTHTIARRVGRFLERQGLLARDAENSYLVGDGRTVSPTAVIQTISFAAARMSSSWQKAKVHFPRMLG